MGRFRGGVAATLVVFSGLTLPMASARAAVVVLAQADKATVPATASSPAPSASPSSSPPQDAVPGSPVRAPAKKSSLSTPACSVRFLEAKIARKLNGRTWVDFRRDECREKETTAVFPKEISPKYSNEKDLDRARRLTCGDQFSANKATNANGGLKWIEKDGGYYEECVSRLKS